MLYDARLAQDFTRDLYSAGLCVIGFSFPVVPKGAARIRVQLCAGHDDGHIDPAIAAFVEIGQRYEVPGRAAGGSSVAMASRSREAASLGGVYTVCARRDL